MKISLLGNFEEVMSIILSIFLIGLISGKNKDNHFMYIRNIVYIVILFLNVIDYIIVLVGIKSYFGNNLSDDEKKYLITLSMYNLIMQEPKDFAVCFKKKILA